MTNIKTRPPSLSTKPGTLPRKPVEPFTADDRNCPKMAWHIVLAWARPSRYRYLLLLRMAALLLVFFWLNSRLLAADVTVFDQQSETGDLQLNDLAHVQITGEIVEGDADKLRKALAEIDARSVEHDGDHGSFVFLDSTGGNVAVALEMGRILRGASAQTFVLPNQTCASSCVFIFSGGVERLFFEDSHVGLHRPRFDYEMFGGLQKDEARKAYTAAVDKCAEFLKEMGVSETLLGVMLKIPSQEIRWLRPEQAEKWALVGTDPAWQEWVRARDIKRMGEAKLAARDRYFDCLTSGGNSKACYESYDRELRQLNANAHR